STTAGPGEAGSAFSSAEHASSPPADAPTPTMVVRVGGTGRAPAAAGTPRRAVRDRVGGVDERGAVGRLGGRRFTIVVSRVGNSRGGATRSTPSQAQSPI